MKYKQKLTDEQQKPSIFSLLFLMRRI